MNIKFLIVTFCVALVGFITPIHSQEAYFIIDDNTPAVGYYYEPSIDYYYYEPTELIPDVYVPVDQIIVPIPFID
jgi:hypothetical protein